MSRRAAPVPWLVAAAACSVDRGGLDRRAFPCDVTEPAPSCGDGWTCYGASGVGSGDFCVPVCAGPYRDDETVCTDDGAALEACAPGAPCRSEGLACLRTDLVRDAGVCLDVTPCSVDADCRDPARSRCASTVIAEMFPNGDLATDHLYCIEACEPLLGAQCLGGGVCPAGFPDVGGLFPPICAPLCDSGRRCPPTFTCLETVIPPLGLPLCIPGLPGMPCAFNTDCFGDCVELLPDVLRVCATACERDADCAALDWGSGPVRFVYTCEQGRCVSPTSLFFNFCGADGACPEGFACRVVRDERDPGDEGIAVCVQPCEQAADCLAGPMPMACADGTCIAATFFAPCARDADCLGDLTCRAIGPPWGERCVIGCAGSADCRAHRLAGPGWFCLDEIYPGADLCTPLLEAGQPCVRDGHCQGGACREGRCAAEG